MGLVFRPEKKYNNIMYDKLHMMSDTYEIHYSAVEIGSTSIIKNKDNKSESKNPEQMALLKKKFQQQ